MSASDSHARRDRLRQLAGEGRRRRSVELLLTELRALTGRALTAADFVEPDVASRVLHELIEQAERAGVRERWREDDVARTADVYARSARVGEALGSSRSCCSARATKRSRFRPIPILADPARIAEIVRFGHDLMMCTPSAADGLLLSRDYVAFEGWVLALSLWGREAPSGR